MSEGTQTDADGDSPGAAALRAAVDDHGEDIAALVEQSDRVKDLIDTTVLVLASAEDDDVAYLADAIGDLVRTADAASTEETVALAEFVGENGEDAAATLEKVVELDRAGTLDDLLELGETLSALDVDEESVGTLNRLLDAVETAEEEAEPVGPLGALRSLRGRDARAGLGFLVSLLRATGRTLVGR